MFLCRHQTLRAPAQRHFEAIIKCRNASRRTFPPKFSVDPPPFSYARSASSRVSPGNTNTPNTPSSSASQYPPKIDTHDIEDDTSSLEQQDTVPKPLRGQERPVSDSFLQKPVASYLALRKDKYDPALNLSLAHFVQVFQGVLKSNRLDLIPMLVADATSICSRNPLRGGYIVTELLRRLTRRRMLTKAQIVRLLIVLRETDQIRYVTMARRLTIARRILVYELDHTRDAEVFALIGPWLAQVLPESSGPNDRWRPYVWEDSSIGPLVPRVIWPLFRVILSLALAGDTKQASSIIARLVNAKRIHDDAIHGTDLSSQDYVYVVTSVLVRTCLLYGWFSRATALLVPTVTARDWISPPLRHLIEDWISVALTSPRDEDVDEVASMIILLVQRTDGYTIPDPLLQRFYEATARNNMPELAETVYHHTYHTHPPPLNATLIWLMDYLQRDSRNVHLARILASHVVNDNIFVPASGRAAFIMSTVTLGFASQARALWERYSTGRDRLYLIGRKALMLRMVSAFVKAESLARRAVSGKPADEAAALRINLKEGAPERKPDQEEDVHTTLQQTPSDDRAEEDHPASEASPPPPHGNANSQFPPSSDASDFRALTKSERGSAGHAVMTRTALIERADDLRRFAEHVFNAYRHEKEPLTSATHHELNALARGAFMLGNDSLAFEVFDMMKKRGVKLDMYDMNVALNVVSKTNPAAGAARIRRLVDRGYEPDAVTFGTVIHWAIHHGDAPLVAELLRMARVYGLKDLSFKTMSSLLHTTVAPEFESLTSPHTQLDHAREIVDTLLDADVLPTPNMGRTCIVAALDAEDPVTAFRFWRQLVKGKVQSADPAQRRLRGQIAEQVRLQHGAGWLDEDRCRIMLSELGFDPVYELHNRRRRAARDGAEGGGRDAELGSES